MDYVAHTKSQNNKQTTMEQSVREKKSGTLQKQWLQLTISITGVVDMINIKRSDQKSDDTFWHTPYEARYLRLFLAGSICRYISMYALAEL